MENKKEKDVKPCDCNNSHAKTVRRITDEIWQCPRCGGVGSVKVKTIDRNLLPLSEGEEVGTNFGVDD